jgi:hypothetical protein
VETKETNRKKEFFDSKKKTKKGKTSRFSFLKKKKNKERKHKIKEGITTAVAPKAKVKTLNELTKSFAPLAKE